LHVAGDVSLASPTRRRGTHDHRAGDL